MEPQPITAAIDDFEEELIQMNITGSTQEELLTWLDKHGVTVSRRTLVRRLKLWQEESPSSDNEQLINLIDHLFHTQPTYSDGLISQRLKEDYNLQATARYIINQMTAYLELVEKKPHLPSTVRSSHSINACYPLPLRELPRLTSGGSPRLHHGSSARKRIG